MVEPIETKDEMDEPRVDFEELVGGFHFSI